MFSSSSAVNFISWHRISFTSFQKASCPVEVSSPSMENNSLLVRETCGFIIYMYRSCETISHKSSLNWTLRPSIFFCCSEAEGRNGHWSMVTQMNLGLCIAVFRAPILVALKLSHHLVLYLLNCSNNHLSCSCSIVIIWKSKCFVVLIMSSSGKIKMYFGSFGVVFNPSMNELKILTELGCRINGDLYQNIMLYC